MAKKDKAIDRDIFRVLDTNLFKLKKLVKSKNLQKTNINIKVTNFLIFEAKLAFSQLKIVFTKVLIFQ